MKKVLICAFLSLLLCLAGCRGEPVQTPANASYPEYQQIASKAENDPRYQWIQAFLDRDAKACADLAGRPQDTDHYGEREKNYEVWYRFLTGLEFGAYSVQERVETSEWGYEVPIVRFEFEVVESGDSVFPVGKYVYDVTEGRMSAAEWTRIGEGVTLEPHLRAFLDRLICGAWSQEAIREGATQYEIGIFDSFLYFHLQSGGESQDIPKEHVENGVEALFGLKGFEASERIATLKDDCYTVLAHGEFTTAHTVESVVKNASQTEVVVQFYADIMSMVKSHQVKYVFEETQGDFPLRLVSIERLSTGVFDPSVWMA